MNLNLRIPLAKQAAIHDFRRRWLAPMVLLSSVALTVFCGFYGLDHVVLRAGRGSEGALDWYLAFDPGSITDAVSSLAGMIAAVFGIVITVVSIVLQLSATRFAGVTRMFLRDRLNLTLLGYYVVTCVCGVWLSVSIKHEFVPKAALVAMLVATTFGLILMVPYFGYVFWFLEPQNIIDRIRAEGLLATRRGLSSQKSSAVGQYQARTITAMEELTDVTGSSISNKDKIIASVAVDAIKDYVLEYLKEKPNGREAWFLLLPEARENPDFVAMDPESLTDLENRRAWVEWKAMKQYLGIYNDALGTMRDINYLIAIDTRYIAEAAAARGDEELVRLVLRYMNSYIRGTLNARNVRTAYNVLNQYRILIEFLLRQGHETMAVEGARYLTYYGRTSFGMELSFVTETIAYDLSSLCQVANELSCSCESDVMSAFLELDQPLRSHTDLSALMGVRKAQVKLAAYYLMVGKENLARRICNDMRDEPRARLETIRSELEMVTTKDFWEIIDRGRNFEYMPPAQQAMLAQFFGWLGVETKPELAQFSPNSIRVSSRA
jgi:hypothetical protein